MTQDRNADAIKLWRKAVELNPYRPQYHGNLARFLDSLSMVSRRENLRLHDRQHLAEARAAVELARQTTEASSVRAGLVRSVAAASALYGKDAQLDAFLRAQRHFPSEWLADTELPAEVTKLGNLLAAIPAP